MAAPIQTAVMTPFPLGVSSFGMPVVGGGALMTTGRVFFVDNTAASKGDDTAHGTSPMTPFATIDFAVGQCAANEGDVILVLPGHAEDITSAAGINCDVAGISIIGVSVSSGRDRAKVTLKTNVAASIDINAANVLIRNLVIDMTGVDAITAGINVAATDFTLEGCELITASASAQAVVGILTNANASRARVFRNFFNGTSDTGTTAAIQVAGTPDGVVVSGNRFVGAYANGGVYVSGSATNFDLDHNTVFNLGVGSYYGFGVLVGTGTIRYNQISVSSITNAIVVATNSVLCIENYAVDSDFGAAQIQQLVPVVGSAVAIGKSLVDTIIGAEMSYNRANYFAVTADFSSATWNTATSHEIATVTGTVRIRIIPVCGGSVTAAGAITIVLGTEDTANAFIASTDATLLLTGKTWLGTTPAFNFAKTSVVDQIVSGGKDVGYTIGTTAAGAGSVVFHCWWEPLDATGAVVLGTGGPL